MFNRCVHHYKGHFPGQPGLVSCSVDSQPPVILILSVLIGQAKTLDIFLLM